MKPGRFPFILIFVVFSLVFFTPSMTQNLRNISSGDETAYIETVPTPEIEVTETNHNAETKDADKYAERKSVTPEGPGETSLTYNGTGKAPIVIKGIVISHTEKEEKVLPEETKL